MHLGDFGHDLVGDDTVFTNASGDSGPQTDEGPAGRNVVTATHDPDSSRELSTTVALLLADIEGVDPVERRVQRFETLDPDALNALFESFDHATPPEASITFRESGVEVTVYENGDIVAVGSNGEPVR